MCSYIELFLQDKERKTQLSQNVYNEDEYMQFAQQLEEKIMSIQSTDHLVEEKIAQQIKLKEIECGKKKE